MDERKLVTIRRVERVIPIDGADKIELVQFGGWQCVVKKRDFNVGDLGVYFEIDSLLPVENLVFSFLKNPNRPEQTHIRLKTKKYLEKISQGLFLPLNEFNNLNSFEEGMDLTEVLGITKFEPQIATHLQGLIKGNRPWFVPKTDEERFQNLSSEDIVGTFEVTEKLDGSSMSVYLVNEEFGVCSRNMELVETENNTFWKVARENELEKVLRFLNKNLVLQGELVGDGIQGNRLKLKGHNFYVFNIYDVDSLSYLSPEDRQELLKEVSNKTGIKVMSVPIVQERIFISLDDFFGKSLNEMMGWYKSFSFGNSLINKSVQREGLVFKRYKFDSSSRKINSFKVINDDYLLKYGE